MITVRIKYHKVSMQTLNENTMNGYSAGGVTVGVSLTSAQPCTGTTFLY